MVRIIVGTIVDVGLGKINPIDVKEILDSKNRCMAGKTAPPQGLFLTKIYY
jgi:tRNA pseudouridine synthase.